MVNRLVFENLKHRPVRTALSAVAIGVQVTMILTLVGLTHGMLNDIAQRSKGTGADIMVRPPGSSVIGNSGNMPEKLVAKIREVPHVALATGTLVQPIGGINTITGIHLDEFTKMSGGFHYLAGGPFKGPQDLIIDDVFARSQHAHVGGDLDLGRTWHITGIIEPGQFSRTFAQIEPLQDMYSATGLISIIWIKVDDPANIPTVINSLRQIGLQDYSIHSVEEYTSLFSVDNIPLIRPFTKVIIGLAAVIGFLVVFQSMYAVVLERTREIGILKALGASPGYILGILLRETVLLSLVGVIVGILMTYGTRELLRIFVPSMPTDIVYLWWPRAGAIALVGSLIGAMYPGLKAARQDAIEALSYD